MIRLFAGIELPSAVREQLHLMAGGVPEARWTEPGNYHLTLAFIGLVDEPVAGDADEALSSIGDRRFDLRLQGVGQFDRGGHTTILWAGVERSEALMHLGEKVRTALARAGIEVDPRKYSPHVTLARIGHAAPQDRVLRFLADHALFATPPIPVDHFALFESARGGGGLVYRPLRRYPLS